MSSLPQPIAVPVPVSRSMPGREQRLRHLMEHDYEFVWRSLRRLGVREPDVDDAAQKVFMVVSDKLDLIEPQSERGFLFQTCLRVASHARRAYRRDRTVLHETDDEPERCDPVAEPDSLLEQKRLRQQVDQVLDTMPIQLRAVFVLYEVEQLTTPEIAKMLGIALGTAASRLRRAREVFVQLVEQVQPDSAVGGAT